MPEDHPPTFTPAHEQRIVRTPVKAGVSFGLVAVAVPAILAALFTGASIIDGMMTGSFDIPTLLAIVTTSILWVGVWLIVALESIRAEVGKRR